MRAVFLGTPKAAVPTLEELVAAPHEVPLVVTQPDRPSGRSGAPKAPPVKEVALARGLEVIQPESVRTPEFLERLRGARPDVLVVVAYGRILPPKVLAVPRLGPVNVHFSLLPRYRGAAPVQWALANGETMTGVSTMLMSEGMDEGDLLLQQEVPIDRGTRAPALLDRLAGIGARLLLETLEGLSRGSLVPRPQDPALATYAPRLKPQDGVVDWALPAPVIEGRVRGFDPWPGVWAAREGRRLRIVEAEAGEGAPATAACGSVLGLRGDALMVACGGGTLLAVRAVQPEGRRTMTARDAVNGRQLQPGDRLEAGQPGG